jgi:tight adherence protein B
MIAISAAVCTAVAVGLLAEACLTRYRRRRARRPGREERVGGEAWIDVSPLQFWITVLAVAAITYLAVLALTGLIWVALVPALVMASLPKAYFARKRSQRLALIQEAWPDGLRDLLSSVRSGASLPTAIEDLASFGPAPLREAFQGFDVYSRSLGVVAALEMVKDDVADPTTDRVVEVLILAYQRGGTVVPQILEDLAEATTRDLWTAEQIRTEALEQKINSRVVFVLPWLVLIAMTARPGPFRDFYSSTAGLLVVAIGGVMSLIGVLIATRLGSQPSEPRVFGGGGER